MFKRRLALAAAELAKLAGQEKVGLLAQVDDDEDVGKIVTDEIPTGLYKMGLEALLKDSRDARIEKVGRRKLGA